MMARELVAMKPPGSGPWGNSSGTMTRNGTINGWSTKSFSPELEMVACELWT
jgi:hypothetical protein